nr:hypothetical protein [uncultured Campylobacter sp.]
MSDHRCLGALSFKKPLLRIEFYDSNQPHRLNLNQLANLIYQEVEALSSQGGVKF